MTPEQFEQAKREFAERWCLKVIECMKEDDYIIHAPDEFLSDLTVLLEQHKEMMCSQCQKQHRTFTYPGRPDPRDVNPYDIRSVHRARNPRKRT